MDGPWAQLFGLAIWLFFVSLPPFGVLFSVLVALMLMRAAALIRAVVPDESLSAEERHARSAAAAQRSSLGEPPTAAVPRDEGRSASDRVAHG